LIIIITNDSALTFKVTNEFIQYLKLISSLFIAFPLIPRFASKHLLVKADSYFRKPSFDEVRY
jgi:hypothetical protein